MWSLLGPRGSLGSHVRVGQDGLQEMNPVPPLGKGEESARRDTMRGFMRRFHGFSDPVAADCGLACGAWCGRQPENRRRPELHRHPGRGVRRMRLDVRVCVLLLACEAATLRASPSLVSGIVRAPARGA